MATPEVAKKKVDAKATPAMARASAQTPYNDNYDRFESGLTTSEPDWNYNDFV